MTGRLIAVVGPSGVGKDSVLNALAVAMPDVKLVRRAITRPAELGGEDYEAISEDEFRRRREAGDFCLSWGAHGLFYGIPDDILRQVQGGADHLVNLSRIVLAAADEVFPSLFVINLTARPETLATRMSARGRETAEGIAKRLARSVPEFAPQLDVRTLSNDGPLSETVQAALDILQPVRA